MGHGMILSNEEFRTHDIMLPHTTHAMSVKSGKQVRKKNIEANILLLVASAEHLSACVCVFRSPLTHLILLVGPKHLPASLTVTEMKIFREIFR